MPNITIQLMSDLHLEVVRGGRPDYECFSISPSSKAEILALLGDIGNICNDRLFVFLKQQTQVFRQVLYILGNHEFYDCSVVCRFFQKSAKFSIIVGRTGQLRGYQISFLNSTTNALKTLPLES
jgi:hypothetical protein